MKRMNFCIIGLGLLGGSYAMALTEKGHRVTAVDIRAEAIQWGIEHGLITGGATERFEALLAEADALVICLYPSDAGPWLRQYQQYFKPGVLITDVCGVKGHYVDEVQAFLRPDVEFIASHPMAGREVSGVEYADCSIFKVANFLITPTAKNTPRGVAFAHDLGDELGFARITELSCQEHDRVIGYVSQLTHAIAVSLMNANDDPHLVDYTGDSFRDLTRIAKINEMLWSQLFFANKNTLCAQIDTFCSVLLDLRDKLASEDEAGLRELFVKSTQRRKLFDKQPTRS